VVNKDSKAFNPSPIYPCKTSWDYSRKIDCDDILNTWKMTFQASDGKERQFLDLLDDNFNVIRLSYTKKGPWLQSFGHLNLLCACAMRAITNHTLIGEYKLRFFLNKEFRYTYGTYPIESRKYILHDCMRFNGYWNPKQDFLSYFVMFLVANPNTFTFIDCFTSNVISRPYN